ncbi:protein phosphatase 2C domain-containing protein [Amycolatopsis lexingtonensis]|uniref:protein phosphatase 2C domain-containing protein n=1 Tax=Amycolatopsis lexingtonensis TaxID=218822 RepID=UPI003F721553
MIDGATFTGADGRVQLAVRGASVRGLAHRYYGVTRQDDYLISSASSGRHLLVVVADGVSAGRCSHLAATAATAAGCAVLDRHLANTELTELDWPNLIRETCEDVRRELDDRLAPVLAPDESVASQSAAVLYLVLSLEPEAGNGHPYACARVGDVSAWTLADTALRPIFPTAVTGTDEYVSSATNAVPFAAPPASVEHTAGTATPGTALIAMTDGLGDPLGDGTGAVGLFLADQWRSPVPELQFAAQVDFARASFDDDRTAVAVWIPEDPT